MKVSKWSIGLAVFMTSVVVTCLISRPLNSMNLSWKFCLCCGALSAIINWIDVIRGIFQDKQALPNLFLIASMANLICFFMDMLLALMESRLPNVFPTAAWLAMGIICWVIRDQIINYNNGSKS